MKNGSNGMKKETKWNRIEAWLRERMDLEGLLGWLSLTGILYGPLDKRLNIKEALEKALKKPVPPHVNFSFCFGGMTFLLFVIQIITGVLLALYYKPSPETAFESSLTSGSSTFVSFPVKILQMTLLMNGKNILLMLTLFSSWDISSNLVQNLCDSWLMMSAKVSEEMQHYWNLNH